MISLQDHQMHGDLFSGSNNEAGVAIMVERYVEPCLGAEFSAADAITKG